MIPTEVFREYSFTPQKFPTIFDLLQDKHTLYITVEDKQRLKLQASFVKYYLSYCVVPTTDPYLHLLMTHDGTVVGLVETEESLTKNTQFDLDIDLGNFLGVRPTIYLTNIPLLNSITFKGSITAEFVTVRKIFMCLKLFKIVATNCEVKFLDGALASSPSLYYCKGKFSLSGSGVFENCSQLRNVDTILNQCIPAKTFSGCEKLESISLTTEMSSLYELDPHIGTDALSGCPKELKINGDLPEIIFRQLCFDNEEIKSKVYTSDKNRTSLFNK